MTTTGGTWGFSFVFIFFNVRPNVETPFYSFDMVLSLRGFLCLFRSSLFSVSRICSAFAREVCSLLLNARSISKLSYDMMTPSHLACILCSEMIINESTSRIYLIIDFPHERFDLDCMIPILEFMYLMNNNEANTGVSGKSITEFENWISVLGIISRGVEMG